MYPERPAVTRSLDLHALRSFVCVIDAGGVTRAAARLNLTQSAVSMQIKRLEDALDLRLLERRGRGVAPTPQGEQLIGYARRMLAINDEALAHIAGRRNIGELVFGAPHDIVYPQTPEVLQRFDRDFPNVRVRMISSFTVTLKEMFARGEADVILTTEHNPVLIGEGETLARRRIMWMGAPGGKACFRDPLPFAAARRCLNRPIAINALEKAGRKWTPVIGTDDESVSVASAAADLAVAALLDGAYAERLIPVPASAGLPDLPDLHINMYMRDGVDLAPIFAGYLRAAYRD